MPIINGSIINFSFYDTMRQIRYKISVTMFYFLLPYQKKFGKGLAHAKTLRSFKMAVLTKPFEVPSQTAIVTFKGQILGNNFFCHPIFCFFTYLLTISIKDSPTNWFNLLTWIAMNTISNSNAWNTKIRVSVITTCSCNLIFGFIAYDKIVIFVCSYSISRCNLVA